MTDRNHSIDSLRFFASFFVIIIHSPLAGNVGIVIETIARFAVPFFFMVSGYYSNCPSRIITKRIQRLLFLLLRSLLVYFLWLLALSFHRCETMELLVSLLSVRTWIEMVVFQQGAFLGHLWFLLALIICYIIWSVLKRAGFGQTLSLAAFLIGVHYLVKIILMSADIPDASFYTRNFLLTGLPMFMIGTYISERNVSENGLSVKKSCLAIALGMLLCFLERRYIAEAELYLGSILIAAGCLVYSIKHPGRYTLFSRVGKCYSEHIYVYHVIVLGLINICASLTGVLGNNFFVSLRPFLVLLVTLFLSVVISILRLKGKAFE